MDTVEGAVGPLAEQSATPVVMHSTVDITQTVIKSDIKELDMPAPEEISPTP